MKLGIDKIMAFMGISVSSIFLIFACVLLFTDLFKYIPKEMKNIVGTILLAYGLIRIISLINKINKNNHETE